MTYLRTLNGEKSLTTVRDYFDAIDLKDICQEELQEKKRMAERAIKHLTVILNPVGDITCTNCQGSKT